MSADAGQAARLEATAREITAGHIPEGVTFRTRDGTEIEGPAPMPELDYGPPEAGVDKN